ncbi:MAG: hypothetical protein IPJ81_17945 [Chitinophagaceae bacterium]|nr:hypothetical protein [Chitinophagaceae bacterium]
MKKLLLVIITVLSISIINAQKVDIQKGAKGFYIPGTYASVELEKYTQRGVSIKNLKSGKPTTFIAVADSLPAFNQLVRTHVVENGQIGYEQKGHAEE